MSSQPDDPIRGIMLVVGATTVFSIADTIAKFLTTDLSAVQINWMRYLIFTIMALVISARSPGYTFRALFPGTQIVRGLCVTASSLLFVLCITTMPLAEAASIGFVSPLIVTVLSIPLLGEVVRLRRWAAVGAGLLGVLIIMRPGTSAFQPAALFGVAGAACWALALVLTRKMAGALERGATTLLWSASIGLIILSAMLPFSFKMPSFSQLILALVQGVLGSLGQWMVILAHRYTAASTLAPIFYIQLIWSTLGGFIVFSAIPDHWTVLGASIIIASGLYTAHRERVRAREKQA